MNYKIIKGMTETNNINRAICIGYFDGVHKGHTELIKKTVEYAKKNNLTATMFTFTKSPKQVIQKLKESYLTSIEEKVKLAKEMGIDEVVALKFDEAIASYSIEEFIEKILKPLNIKHLVCGFDFSFAKFGRGNPDTLKQYFDVTVVNEILLDNKKVASSYINECLNTGDLKTANKQLGRNYYVTGKVVHGSGVGTKLGFPTMNVDYANYVLPICGVYACLVEIDEKVYKGMANIGHRPTINQTNEIVLEINVFDYNDDAYDKEVKVSFVDFIREENKFNDKESLINAIKSDKIRVEEILK